MVEKVSELKPPKGISRLLFRVPIWLYNYNLGWLLGKRFLKITHIGRKSGLPRQVVLEIVKYEPSSETYYVAAAWGEHSDWVKNIRVNPQIQVQVSNRRREMIAETLTPERAEEVILDYSQRHPSAMMSLARMMGYKLDGSEQDFRDLGRQLLMFALKPRPQGSQA
jgi:deazaflavin-dependent oxidoreductase (nitroreductase family)